MRYLRWWLASLAATVLALSPATAEDVRGRWSFSFGGGILSTLDDIRNNAAVVSELNNPANGIPGDISDDIIPPGSTDRRQDDLLGRETEIEETAFYNFGASYGLTSWLSIMADLSYYQGNVSNLDSFHQSQFVVAENDQVVGMTTTPPRDGSVPLSVGELTQIPVMFSAVFRFRKDSPFNPILGAGVGWMFTDLEESQALHDLNNEILRGFQRTMLWNGKAENFQNITDLESGASYQTTCAGPANTAARESRACLLGQETLDSILAQLEAAGTLTPQVEAQVRAQYEPYINADFLPTKPFVTAEVSDGFAYQLLGGAEYHFNDRWSAYVLGRYIVTDAKLRVKISDNGNLVTPTTSGGKEDAVTFETSAATFNFVSESNLRVANQATGGSSLTTQPEVLDSWISVQGGEIDLTSFSLAAGIRYTF